MVEFERIPEREAEDIADIVSLTLRRLDQRYPGATAVLRGVHPKDHGCVTAKFTILKSIPEMFQVGVFAKPGQQFDTLIRFSNAAVNVKDPDSNPKNGSHGSRGMAVKVLGVSGSPLMATKGPLTQDFLMINQPVFAFANVEDYKALSQILLDKEDVPDTFFARLGNPDPDVKRRAQTTLGIINRIKSTSLNPAPAAAPAVPPALGAYQEPPISPVDNRYFGAAAFLFGNDRVMRFSAKPLSPVSGKSPDISDPNYLRRGLRDRLARDGDNPQDVVFEFQIQVRDAKSLAGNLDSIEDVCVDWNETDHPFVTVATIVIPPQEINTAERQSLSEDLIFSPWHGLVEHRPLGGINRLRRAVYVASAQNRHAQPTPTSSRCPFIK